MSRFVLGLVVVLVSLLAGASAHAAPLGAADQRARAAALRMLERARSPDHRRYYRIVVPAVPSHLPRRYTIQHHANHINHVPSGRVIDVVRDERGARVELFDSSGIARATLPAAELDALVRQAFYLHRARSESRDDSIGLGGFGYASHMPQRLVRIDGEGFSLTTAYAQPINDEVDGPELELFAHTNLVTRFEALVEAHVDPEVRLEHDAAMLAEMERRLRAIPRGTTPLWQYDRHDRDAVLARLLGHQLVKARVEHVLPLLRRKGLDEQAYALALSTMPVEALPSALPGLLCSDEYEVHVPALALASEHREVAREAMIYALGCELSEDKVVRLLRELSLAPPVKGAPLGPARALLSDPRSSSVRMEAARALWVVDHDVDAQRWLRNAALAGARRGPIEDGQVEALMALRAGIDRTAPGHEALAELVIELLRGVPMVSGGDELRLALVLSVVASHGEPRHAEPLAAWLDHPDPETIEDVVEAIEQLDPERARAEARARVGRYARGAGEADYAHAVRPFLELLVRHDEAVVLPELRAAAEGLREEVPVARDPRRQAHAAFVAYFEAAPARRAAAALRLIGQIPGLAHSTRRALIERHVLDERAVVQAELAAAREPLDEGR